MKSMMLAFVSSMFAGLSITHETQAAPRTWVVDQYHERADDNGSGTADQPFQSIRPAAEAAMPGDTVRVHAGVYRERVAPARGGEHGAPITYAVAPGDQVVLKGSELWHPDWSAVEGYPGLYTAKLDDTMFADGKNPYRTKLVAAPGEQDLTLGQVFVDGEPLHETDSKARVAAAPGRWQAIDGGDALLVHFPLGVTPESAQVELTVRDRVFAPRTRGLGYIHVRGFVVEHCANQFPRSLWAREGEPQAGALGCRGGHHWTIENNTIRFAKTVGLDCGNEGPNDTDGLGQPQPKNAGHHVIRGNTIVDNGACGIAGYHSYRTQIIGNTIERNNRLGFMHAEKAGMKFHGFVGGLIEANLVRDNDGPGIWLDNIYRHSRVTRNLIVGNTGTGLFVEMGAGPLLVDNNVIAYTVATQGLAGDGVYAHDASGVTFAHNLLFFNANFGLWSHVATDRRIPRSLADDADDAVAALRRHDRDWRPRRELASALAAAQTDEASDAIQAVRRLIDRRDTRWDPAAFTDAIDQIHQLDPDLRERLEAFSHSMVGVEPTHEKVAASNWTIVNNLFLGNHRGAISLPVDSERARGNTSDFNLFAAGFDPVTSETSALELATARFQCNSSKGRISLEHMRDELNRRLSALSIDASEYPATDAWDELMQIELVDWQMLTGHDENSRQPNVVRPTLSARALQLRFVLGASGVELSGERVPGVDRDFYGTPIDAGRVLPGPFQSLTFHPELDDRSDWTEFRGPYATIKKDPALANEFLLWPIPMTSGTD